MLNSLHIATDGYLNSCKTTLTISVSGYWYPYVEIEETNKKPIKGGGNTYYKYGDYNKVLINTRKVLLREDEEILIMLKAWIKVQE